MLRMNLEPLKPCDCDVRMVDMDHLIHDCPKYCESQIKLKNIFRQENVNTNENLIEILKKKSS